MESEQDPSSSLLLHQHDFSSLVSWPHHWQPESFEIILNSRSVSPGSKTLNIEMTQVVPEHVARAKINTGASGPNPVRRENNSTHKSRPQRSNSATLSTISVTCDTDTSMRSRQSRMESSVSKKNSNPSKHIVASQSTSTLINTGHVQPPPSSLSVRSHKPIQTSASNTAIANSLIVTSGMNIIHEKSRLPLSTSTVSIPNRHVAKASPAGATGGGTHPPSSRTLSNRHKTASLDDPNRSTQTRGLGKSVLEHLVFVFPENVRKMLAGPKNLPSRTADIPQPTESNEPVEPPTNDELKGWAESFDKLMMSPCGRRYFRDFLRSEYSEENFLFWMSCEALKNEQNPERIEEKARLIYEDYISILSPKEVSLDSRVREIINKNMVEPSPHTFDEAQLQIYTLMHRDSYPRFINSQIYRRLVTPEGTRT